ncbi:MAG: hypothetical protein JSS14_21760 [Proteobacteria bacterium]|nr:hypothetical protein [Pseudomonadota bacterium]
MTPRDPYFSLEHYLGATILTTAGMHRVFLRYDVGSWPKGQTPELVHHGGMEFILRTETRHEAVDFGRALETQVKSVRRLLGFKVET